AQALELAHQLRDQLRRGDEVQADGSSEADDAVIVAPLAVNNGVFDGESRTNMNAYAQNHPWNKIGVMSGACTVFKMINNYTAVTSAHCVYGSSGWLARRPLQFSAGSATPKGVLHKNCYAITVPGGWASDVGDDEYDYAVIRLREGGVTGAS